MASVSTSTSTQDDIHLSSEDGVSSEANARIILPSAHIRSIIDERAPSASSSSNSIDTTSSGATCSISTATHASAGTDTDSLVHDPTRSPNPATDVSTSTSELYQQHPHVKLFPYSDSSRSFLHVFHPYDCSYQSTRALSLMNTLLSLHSDQLVQSLQPTYLSSLARDQVFRYIQSVVFQVDPSLHLFSYGSVPLKTYLPEGDIDIGVVLNTSGRGGGSSAQSFLLKLKNRLELDAAREKQMYMAALFAHQNRGGVGPPPDAHSLLSPYTLTHLAFINAPEVKLLKLQYNHSLLIDISVNTTSALATVCWIEEMEREMVRAFHNRQKKQEENDQAATTEKRQRGQITSAASNSTTSTITDGAAPVSHSHPTFSIPSPSSSISSSSYDRLLDGKSVTFSHHLLKRSILLIKAWSTYESRTLASAHSLLSTYALEILVIYVLQQFPSFCISPLHVLYIFLAFYGTHWSWEKHVLSLGGPVSIDAIQAGGVNQASGTMWENSEQFLMNKSVDSANDEGLTINAVHEGAVHSALVHPTPLLELELLTKLCTKYARKSNSSNHHGSASGVSDLHPSLSNDGDIDATFPVRSVHVSTSTSNDVSTSTPAALFTAAAVPKSFAMKHFNIIDPLDPANNLGKSVNYSSFLRIKACWARGAADLESLFRDARSIGEQLCESEMKADVVGASHILQLLQSLHHDEEEEDNKDKRINDIDMNKETEKNKRKASNHTDESFTPFPLNVTAPTPRLPTISEQLKSNLRRFRQSLRRFFRCTYKKLDRRHRPDLTGLHADDSMQVLQEASEHHHRTYSERQHADKHEERNKASETTSSEREKGRISPILKSSTTTNGNPIVHSTSVSHESQTSDLAGVDMAHMRSPPNNSNRTKIPGSQDAAIHPQRQDESVIEDETGGDTDDETSSIASSSTVSSLNSQTSSPVIHAVLNLGPNAIDRLSRASSSFSTSVFTPTPKQPHAINHSTASILRSPQQRIAGGSNPVGAHNNTSAGFHFNMNEVTLGLGLGLIPAGSVSQPSSLPSSPPSTPPARSSLPASPTQLPAPFPTPQTQRMPPLSFSPTIRFRSPFPKANATHFSTPLLASPPLHRSLLTHSPTVKSFMLSPGVHGLAGGSLPAPALSAAEQHHLPAPAILSATNMPTIRTFPGVRALSPKPTSIMFHPFNHSSESTDSSVATGKDSMTSTSTSFTTSHSFPPNHPNTNNMRPFILSQLQEASALAQRSTSPALIHTNSDVSRSQTPATANASLSSSVVPSPVIRPHSSNSIANINAAGQQLLQPTELNSEIGKSGNIESYSAPPLALNYSSDIPTSATPPVSAVSALLGGTSSATPALESSISPISIADATTASGLTLEASNRSQMQTDSMSNATVDSEGLSMECLSPPLNSDPLYNDLTDLQHQYNLLRYLTTSFHASGSHTHAHTQHRSNYHHHQHNHQPQSKQATVTPAASSSTDNVTHGRFDRPERERDRKKDHRNLQQQASRNSSVQVGSSSSSTVATVGEVGKSNTVGSKKAWAKRDAATNPHGPTSSSSSSVNNRPSSASIPKRDLNNSSSSGLLATPNSNSPAFSNPQSPLLASSSLSNSMNLVSSRSSSPPLLPHNMHHAYLQGQTVPANSIGAAGAHPYQQQLPLITLVPTAIERMNANQKAKAKKQLQSGASTTSANTAGGNSSADSPGHIPLQPPPPVNIKSRAPTKGAGFQSNETGDITTVNSSSNSHSPSLQVQHRHLPPHPLPLPIPMMPMPMPMPIPGQQVHPMHGAGYFPPSHPRGNSPSYLPMSAPPFVHHPHHQMVTIGTQPMNIHSQLHPHMHHAPYPFPPQPIVVAPPPVIVPIPAPTSAPNHSSTISHTSSTNNAPHQRSLLLNLSSNSSKNNIGTKSNESKAMESTNVAGNIIEGAIPHHQQVAYMSHPNPLLQHSFPPPINVSQPHALLSQHFQPTATQTYHSSNSTAAVIVAPPPPAMSWAQNLSARFGVSSSSGSSATSGPTSPNKIHSPQPSPSKAKQPAPNSQVAKRLATQMQGNQPKGRELFAAKSGGGLQPPQVSASISVSQLSQQTDADGWETAEYSKKRGKDKGAHHHSNNATGANSGSGSSGGTSSSVHEREREREREKNRHMNQRSWRKEQSKQQTASEEDGATALASQLFTNAPSSPNASDPSLTSGLWRVGASQLRNKPAGASTNITNEQ